MTDDEQVTRRVGDVPGARGRKYAGAMKKANEESEQKWPVSSIWWFLLIVSGLSVIPTYLEIRAGDIATYDALVDKSAMWCPAVAALIACMMFSIPKRQLGVSLPRLRFAVAGYVIPVVIFTVAYALLGISGVLKLTFSKITETADAALHLGPLSGVVGIGLISTMAVIIDCASTLGEELGWRGFLVPALAQRMSFLWTCLISGAIWSVWHYPLIFAIGFGGVGSVFTSTVLFTADTMLLAAIMAWLRLKSGSIWPTVILHANNNVLSYRIFEKLPIMGGSFTERVSKIAVEAVVLLVIMTVFDRRREDSSRADVVEAR